MAIRSIWAPTGIAPGLLCSAAHPLGWDLIGFIERKVDGVKEMNGFRTAFLPLVMLLIGFAIGQVSARPHLDKAVALAKTAGEQAHQAGEQATKAIEQTESCVAGWKHEGKTGRNRCASANSSSFGPVGKATLLTTNIGLSVSEDSAASRTVFGVLPFLGIRTIRASAPKKAIRERHQNRS